MANTDSPSQTHLFPPPASPPRGEVGGGTFRTTYGSVNPEMTSSMPSALPTGALTLRIHGQVQGVGFRPFVYRLATRLKLTGWVQNLSGEVAVWIEGHEDSIAAFQTAVIHEAPPLAKPTLGAVQRVEPHPWTAFVIRSSHAAEQPDIHIPPDYFTCDDCLAELRDPTARRFRYPFINCTQCGPRYTLIRALPYDRPNTTLAAFPLCADCRCEYENPADRRFHAQPLACPVCGPQVTFRWAHEEPSARLLSEVALQATVAALRAGHIVAAKGVGGYHLLCDARHSEAVQRLRVRKHRPDKPFAVMFPQQGEDGLAGLREFIELDDITAQQLRDPMRPIVLATKRTTSTLAPAIAPGLQEIGVFLPYSPLHHLLLSDFNGPLVATSGNLSGEPVITDESLAELRLSNVADAFLHHNRPIERPADDAVYRVLVGKARPLRIGRGNAPLEWSLPHALAHPILAVGGSMKVTVALAWEKRLVMSPHIGDLDSPRGRTVFQQVTADLQRLYGVTANTLICDAHPDYASTRWAKRQGLPVKTVYHHLAHASALAAEYPTVTRWLMFTWDGVGWGMDGTIWGGETLWGRPGAWVRVASLRPFYLPGGDAAGRQPWRAAAALCWEAGLDWHPDPAWVSDWPLAQQAWLKKLNCPSSSAVGRLCDAAATLITGLHHTSFEGQAPMQLEALAHTVNDAALAEAGLPDLPMPLVYSPLPPPPRGGRWEGGLSESTDAKAPPLCRMDWSVLLPILRNHRIPPAHRARWFHQMLIHSVVHQIMYFQMNQRIEFEAVGLTGGVFQNRLLSDGIAARLSALGVPVYLPTRFPCNDGGLSVGQVIEATAPMEAAADATAMEKSPLPPPPAGGRPEGGIDIVEYRS